MSYKIKISCTTEKELCFREKKIDQNQYSKIHSILKSSHFDFIDKTIILHKKMRNKVNKPVTIRTIELFCNSEMNKKDLLKFTKLLKKHNFKSKVNTSISFIDTASNDILLKSKFTSEKFLPPEKRKQKIKNNSKYFTEQI